MKIDKLHKNPSIGSKAPLKANRVKDTSFKEILDSTMTKAIESNFDNIFQDAAEKYGLPSQLLKAVAKVESNFNPKAVSSAGASGVMQLMPGTAKGLGVTDVFDAQENINGGAKYLSQLYKRYDGDLRLTLAVTGRELTAAKGKPIPNLLGKNTKYNEDETAILSTIEGQVNLKKER